MLVTSRPFQKIPMYTGKDRSFPLGEQLKCASLCQLPTKHTNVRLGWKEFTWNKHSSLFCPWVINHEKSFRELFPGKHLVLKTSDDEMSDAKKLSKTWSTFSPPR